MARQPPPAAGSPPPPDFGAAVAVVAERVKNFREIAVAVFTMASAIAGVGIWAWMYFASQAEVTKMRCLVYAHVTVTAYNERMDLYDLEVETKTRIKNILATDLASMSAAGKIEQLGRISALDRELAGIEKRRDIDQEEYKVAQQKLDTDSCSTDVASKASEKGDKK